MKLNRIIPALVVVGSLSCTRLDTKLQDSITGNPNSGGSINVGALLNGAYNSLTGILHSQDQLFSLQETTTDEALVPTRGGDWDDNGVWRVLHEHTWTNIHSQFQSVFIGLGGVSSAATTVLAFNPTPQQAAEALFLRSLSQFYVLDMYGQVPYRNPADYNAVSPAPVLQPAAAIDTLVATLTKIIPILPASNAPYKASPDAAKFLLMKVLLNKGAWLNRQAPTFADADMQQVITLGQQLITSGSYALTPNYFDNFGPNNAATGTEKIFTWNNTGASSANGINAGGINARWMMTLHYNSWDQQAGNAGWNGFSTVADFYNTFQTGDKRVGGQPFAGVTDVSGLRPGFVVGPQVDKNNAPLKDRQGNPLSFTNDVRLIEIDKNRLEVAGIRVIKYPPDYNAYNGGNQRNQLQIFRYADVLLMVAEANMRLAAPNELAARTIVNALRTVRGAAPLGTLVLVNPSNVDDPATLLAERGRELYWESWRRQDLIRFGVYLKPWALKEADADPVRNLLYPIAPDQLLANPNLVQNPGY